MHPEVAVPDSSSHIMPPEVIAPRTRVIGWVISGVVSLLILFGAAFGLSGAKQAVDGSVALGWQPHHVPLIVLYLVPRTAPLGAVLFTGYFGGAVATHLRLDQPFFSSVLVPVYVATLFWAGLYLRDARVRALLRPPRT